MRISEKKKTALYGTIHDEIMEARMKIWAMRMDAKPSIHEIDNILSDLCMSAPRKAVDCLIKSTPTEGK